MLGINSGVLSRPNWTCNLYGQYTTFFKRRKTVVILKCFFIFILCDEIVALALLNRCRYKYCNMTSVKISRDYKNIIIVNIHIMHINVVLLHSRPKQMQATVRH